VEMKVFRLQLEAFRKGGGMLSGREVPGA